MITNRELLKTDYPELGYIIHMDGHSTLAQKTDTWNTIRTNLPPNIYMGWKNFYDEDRPTPHRSKQCPKFQPQILFRISNLKVVNKAIVLLA